MTLAGSGGILPAMTRGFLDPGSRIAHPFLCTYSSGGKFLGFLIQGPVFASTCSIVTPSDSCCCNGFRAVKHSGPKKAGESPSENFWKHVALIGTFEKPTSRSTY